MSCQSYSWKREEKKGTRHGEGRRYQNNWVIARNPFQYDRKTIHMEVSPWEKPQLNSSSNPTPNFGEDFSMKRKDEGTWEMDILDQIVFRRGFPIHLIDWILKVDLIWGMPIQIRFWSGWPSVRNNRVVDIRRQGWCCCGADILNMTSGWILKLGRRSDWDLKRI